MEPQMSENRFTPKYILLSVPTLKYSRSTNEQSFNGKNFDLLQPHQVEPAQGERQKSGTIKDSGVDKNLKSVREELNYSIQSIAIEQKRNNVLKELNLILQESNRKAEEKEKRELKPLEEKERRQLEKEEYEIDQNLQKYNEEVARITGLREQVDSARTDRVVFSALFKKIQWEIKHYENMYWETITKTELHKSAKEEEIEEKKSMLQGDVLEEFQPKEDMINCHPHLERGLEVTHRFFMTHPENGNQKHHKKTVEHLPEPSKEIMSKIRQIEGKIDKVVKNAECLSTEQTLAWYKDLGKENRKLRQSIEDNQWLIQEIQQQIERLRMERRDSQITGQRHMKKLKNIPSTRKLRSYRHLKENSQEVNDNTATQIVEQLAKHANLSTSGRSLFDVVSELEQILCGSEVQRSERREVGNSESSLQCMLLKMERFQSCEKILSKQQLQGEYLRELSRLSRQVKVKR